MWRVWNFKRPIKFVQQKRVVDSQMEIQFSSYSNSKFNSHSDSKSNWNSNNIQIGQLKLEFHSHSNQIPIENWKFQLKLESPNSVRNPSSIQIDQSTFKFKSRSNQIPMGNSNGIVKIPVQFKFKFYIQFPFQFTSFERKRTSRVCC